MLKCGLVPGVATEDVKVIFKIQKKKKKDKQYKKRTTTYVVSLCVCVVFA